MNPKLCKRFQLGKNSFFEGNRSSSVQDTNFSKTSSVQDQAALLLSIAEIAKSELCHADGTALSHHDRHHESDSDSDDLGSLPKFPRLSDINKPMPGNWLVPRTESIGDILSSASELADSVAAADAASGGDLYPANRLRAVSMDALDQSPTSPRGLLVEADFRATSPLLSLEDPASPKVHTTNLVSPMTSPISNRRLPLRKQSLRLSTKAKREHRQAKKLATAAAAAAASSDEDDSPVVPRSVAYVNRKSKPLQGVPPKGITTKKIQRKKFSWKNYPELEQYLIANREEYLRHSALNYTVQQKQYNNRLTERLLELATENGYMFDTVEFSFVTVRDRIRCYYKSYVQSAKKRGILMGYAARKAGLLTEHDLERTSSRAGRIVTP